MLVAGLAVALSVTLAACSPSSIEGSSNTAYTSKYGYDIELSNPQANSRITSPLTVSGRVKGAWAYLGKFDVEIVDAHHKTVAKGTATMKGDWGAEKENPVHFAASVPFKAPATGTGFLVLHKANPGEDKAMNDWLEVPIKF